MSFYLMKKTMVGEVADVQTGPFGSQLHKEDYVIVGQRKVTKVLLKVLGLHCS